MNKSELCEEFWMQAEWRDRKAEEYPRDQRNGEAAELLRKLGDSVANCPDDVVKNFCALFADFESVELWNEQLREIGFHSWPQSAEELYREFIAERAPAVAIKALNLDNDDVENFAA